MSIISVIFLPFPYNIKNPPYPHRLYSFTSIIVPRIRICEPMQFGLQLQIILVSGCWSDNLNVKRKHK